MTNAYARRRRLGQALLDIRVKRKLTHAELAARSGVNGSVISRLETAVIDRHPNPHHVEKLLAALDVSAAERSAVERYAEEGAERGWWDQSPWARMGAGQRDWAIVEAAAAEIRQYAGLLIPGLAQTADFARDRTMVGGAPVDADTIVAGRLRRQRILDAAAYQLVLEEQAVRRSAVAPAVMREQLRHLIELAGRPNVSVRVLAVDARLGRVATPRAPFAHISYPDPDDPEIVIVDNVATALVVADADEVSGYVHLHQQLHAAALSDADSAALIQEVADSLAA